MVIALAAAHKYACTGDQGDRYATRSAVVPLKMSIPIVITSAKINP